MVKYDFFSCCSLENFFKVKQTFYRSPLGQTGIHADFDVSSTETGKETDETASDAMLDSTQIMDCSEQGNSHFRRFLSSKSRADLFRMMFTIIDNERSKSTRPTIKDPAKKGFVSGPDMCLSGRSSRKFR
jgi:hypothetical protein